MPDELGQVVAQLKAKRGVIEKMTPHQQAAIYSTVFNKLVAPRIRKTGVSDQDLQLAKIQWVAGVSGKGSVQLPETYGKPKTELGFGGTLGVDIEALAAGAVGGVKNIVRFPFKPGRTPEAIDKPLREVERKLYSEAERISPEEAKWGAGVGHLLPSFATYEAGAAAVPKVLGPVVRAAVGGATGAIPYDSNITTTQLGTQAGINTVLDMILRGGGRAVRTAAGKVTGRVAQRAAARGATVTGEEVLDKELEKLNPQKYAQVKAGQPLLRVFTTDEVHQAHGNAEASRRAAIKATQDAEKAAKAAAKAKPTAEQRAVAAVQAKAAREAENKEAKAFAKRLNAYRKLTGNVPTPGSGHYERLKAGEEATTVVAAESKTAGAQAEVSATQSEATNVAQTNPQAVAAVGEFQKAAGPSSEVGWVPFSATPEGKGLTARIKEKVVAEKAKSMFDVTIDPADYTRMSAADVKKNAEAKLNLQAVRKVEEIRNSQLAETEKTKAFNKIANEVKTARERIRTSKVPTETSSYKGRERERTQAKRAEGSRTQVKQTEEQLQHNIVAPPESIEQDIDLNKQLQSQLVMMGHGKVYDAVVNALYKRGQTDTKVINEALQTALAKLKKAS